MTNGVQMKKETMNNVLIYTGVAILVAFCLFVYREGLKEDRQLREEFRKDVSLGIKALENCKNPAVTYYDDKFRYDTTVSCDPNNSGNQVLVHEIIERKRRSVQVLVQTKGGQHHRVVDDIGLGPELDDADNLKMYRRLVDLKEDLFYRARAPHSERRIKEAVEAAIHPDKQAKDRG